MRAACLKTGFFYGRYFSQPLVLLNIKLSLMCTNTSETGSAALEQRHAPHICALSHDFVFKYFPILHAVANHGIEEALVEQVFEENRKFFSLPEQEKRRILADENNRC